MVYLKKNSEPQTLFIPRSGEVDFGRELRFELENTTDHRTYAWDVQNVDMSDLYFNVSVILPECVPFGEYKYSLKGEGVLISCGLCIVEGAQTTFTQFEQDIEFKQYERS